MIRKLIRLSPSTSVVSLPSPWIKKNKLQKGDDLFVEERENRVMVSSRNSKSERETSFDISGISDKKFVWFYFDAAYAAGYDSITILFDDKSQADVFSKIERYFPGMMICEERKNMVRFKSITDSPEEDLLAIISRIFNMKIAIIEDGIDAIKKPDYAFLSRMKKRDYSVNTYVDYCFRQLNKYGFDPLSKVGSIHTYIKILEMLSDKICAAFVEIGCEKKKTTVLPFEKLLSTYRALHKIHLHITPEGFLRLKGIVEKNAYDDIKDTELKGLFNEINKLLLDLLQIELEIGA